MQVFKNNAYSILGAPLTNASTTLTVAAGQGDRFPAIAAPDFALVTLQDASNNIEIVKVTARTAGADAMTIERATEGTTARAWSIGDIVELRLTAGVLAPLGVFEGANSAAAVRGKINVPTRTGGDASGTWDISISGNAATASTTSGNAGTATELQTARKINGTDFDGSADITTAKWGTARDLTIGDETKSVDGSAAVEFTLAEIGATPVGTTVDLVGDQEIEGVKTFADTVVLGGSEDFSTAGWIKAAKLDPGTGLFWPKGTSSRAKIIGGSAEAIYFAASTADDDSAASTNPFTFAMDTGAFTATGNITAFSDERLKTAWDETVLYGEFIYRLARVKAGTYTRADTGERQVGVSAQSLREAIPEAVHENADGMLSVAYGNAALAACVALAREVQDLRARIAALEAR